MIRLEGLVKSFQKTRVLDSLALTIEAGERIALVGSNGAGKTTLIRCLLGEYTHDGRVSVDGLDPRRDRAEVLKRVGFVPQLPPPLKMPVEDLIAFAAGVSGADDARIVRVAGELGLDAQEVGKRPFMKLSGGQKQKLLIAIALGRDAHLLILDEPAANLDPAARRALFDMLAQRSDDTMIVSSHRVDEVASLVTRVVEMERGRVVFDDRLVQSSAMESLTAHLHIAQSEPAFTAAMEEWGFVAEGCDLVWRGVIAGPDRLRFMHFLSRYSGLLVSAAFGTRTREGRQDESIGICA